MKQKLLYILFFSCFSLAYAQTKDSVTLKPKYKPNFMVGVDVGNSVASFFSDRKLYQGFISTNYNGKLHFVADLGVEKNIYDKNGYDSSVNGPFLKLGAIYMLSTDRENIENGFYAGGKVAASFYNQEYKAVPVRGFGGSDTSVSFPSSIQSSYWMEAAVGGRVQLFNSQFFIDVNIQPKYLLYSTKQDNIQPMIVPGFGKSSGKFNMGFAWNIAYKF